MGDALAAYVVLILILVVSATMGSCHPLTVRWSFDSHPHTLILGSEAK